MRAFGLPYLGRCPKTLASSYLSRHAPRRRFGIGLAIGDETCRAGCRCHGGSVMIANNCPDEALPFDGLDSEVAELSLLLPVWQIGALEQAAQAEGVTVAQLLRRIVNRTLTQRSLNQPGYYYG